MFSQPHGLFQLQWPPTWLSVNIATKEFVPVVMAAALWDNLAMVSITNKRSANNPFCPTFLVPVLFLCLLYVSLLCWTYCWHFQHCCRCSVSWQYSPFYSLGPTGTAGHCPILNSEALPTWGTRLDLTSLDQFLLSLLAQGLASSTLVTYRSGIRWYTAFCQQFGLTPLPLSDLNLCHFVSYLHQQQLSPASVCLYLAALCYLQIVAGHHNLQPGEFPRLQCAVQA